MPRSILFVTVCFWLLCFPRVNRTLSDSMDQMQPTNMFVSIFRWYLSHPQHLLRRFLNLYPANYRDDELANHMKHYRNNSKLNNNRQTNPKINNMRDYPTRYVSHVSLSDSLGKDYPLGKNHLVGGLVAIFYFPRNIGNNHPN